MTTFALVAVPALLLAAVGTAFVLARSLEDTIGQPPETIFLALFLGSLVGLGVVYYAFRLDVKSDL